jgi:hypothetical protein
MNPDRFGSILRSLPARLSAVVISCSVVFASQIYYVYHQVFNGSTLLFGVLGPLVVGSVLLLVTDQTTVFLGFVAFFWSVVDDAPVNFDSVLTWPAVTRIHPLLPHLEMEILLHALTLFLLLGAVWINLRKGGVRDGREAVCYGGAIVTFVITYLQNIPLRSIRFYVSHSWYQLDLVEHLLAVLIFALVILVARWGIGHPKSQAAPSLPSDTQIP